MLIATKPDNEEARLRLLRSLGILDTAPEESFDRITRIAAKLLQVPVALVSLVDQDRQWFKSRVGVDACETSRDIAFCAHALHVDDVLVVEDATADLRFFDNPLVTGPSAIRFYAGVPLRSEDGLTLGTLCVIDTHPRKLTDSTAAALKDLARMAERELLQHSLGRDIQMVWDSEREARALSEARFAMVFQQTPTGKAIVDLQGRFTAVNPKLCEITGYQTEELLTKTFPEITHPDDLNKDLLLVADLLFGRTSTYVLEKRYLRKNGTFVWVELNVSLVRNPAGAPDHFIAVVLDITARKQSEEMLKNYQHALEQQVAERTLELTRSRETLQVITDNLPVLIAQVDRNLCYQFNNDVYRQVFGLTPASLRGRSMNSNLRPELFAELQPYFARALAGERVTCDHVRYSIEQDRIWSATYIPDVRNGEVLGFFVMSQDITERKRVERSLHDKAMLDALTGLPNRRALHDHLAAIVSNTQQFALFFIDLDGFKSVNDQHGHDAGDDLLKQVAGRLTQTMRKGDLVCRLAGDEFVVVAPDVLERDTAARIAEQLRDALSSPFELAHGSASIGASLGIVLCAGGAGRNIDTWLSQADGAMYEAKRRGRNGWRFADSSDS